MHKNIKFALILMGFTSLIVQSLLIREFLVSFYGNELSIGIILGNWIALEALGSWLFSRLALKIKNPYLGYALLQTGIALYLPLSILIIRNIKNILGITPGEGIGVLIIFFSSFFISLPLSIMDGAEFPFGCRLLENKNKWKVATEVYILEAIGFILAGPVFTLLLLGGFSSFLIVFYLCILNLLSAFLLLRIKKIKPVYFLLGSLLLALLVSHSFLANKLHLLSVKNQWKKQNVLAYENSPYANLAVTKMHEQLTFYSDGIPIITTPNPDISFIEEITHFSLLACTDSKKVLILSGGVGGIIKEALKHPLQKIIYTELDPKLIKLILRFPTELTEKELKDPRLEIKYIDAKRFLKTNLEEFDVIILNLPIPLTLQLNRFYTKEFFQEVKLHLTEEGIFVFSLPGSLSYLSKELIHLNSTILETLKELFYVKVIPGDNNLYLASKKEFSITPDLLITRLKERKVTTQLLNQNYLNYRLDPYWSNWFLDSLKTTRTPKKNQDLLPLGTFYSIVYWNSIFSKGFGKFFENLNKINPAIILGVLFLLALVLFLGLKIFKKSNLPILFSVFSTGFWGMSLELILIYFYQIVFGLIFSHLALLTTSFMLGLTLGGTKAGKTNNHQDTKRIILNLEKKMIFFTLILWPSLLFLNRETKFIFSLLFFLLSGILGYLVGKEFPLANKIYLKKSKLTGMLYALDLAGAYFSSLLISLVFVPLLGVLFSLVFLVCLKGLSFGLLKIFTSDI